MIKFWKDMEAVTRGRMIELEIAILKAASGMSMRWLQGMLETNKKWNDLAKSEVEILMQHEKKRQKLAEFKRQQYRANDE